MSNQHEDKTHPCRIVGCKEITQASRRDRAIGATWTCSVHRRMLTLSATERAQLAVLSGPIQQGRLAIDAAGWLTQVAPKPPPQGCPIVMDSGEPRYQDWNPHIIGGDEQPGGGDDGRD